MDHLHARVPTTSAEDQKVNPGLVVWSQKGREALSFANHHRPRPKHTLHLRARYEPMTTLVGHASIPVPHLSDKEEALQQEQHKKAPDQTQTQTTKVSASGLLSTDCANRPKPRPGSLPIHSFNHISKETDNVEELVRFYTKVMGFRRIKRPPFPFAGAWYVPTSCSCQHTFTC